MQYREGSWWGQTVLRRADNDCTGGTEGAVDGGGRQYRKGNLILENRPYVGQEEAVHRGSIIVLKS